MFGLFDEKPDDSALDAELQQLEGGSLLQQFFEKPDDKEEFPEKPESKKRDESSIDPFLHAVISASKNGRKIKLKRPFSESLVEVDEEQFRTFLDFYGAPCNSAVDNQNRVNEIIEALTNSQMVDQVTEEDVGFLISHIRNIETVPKRGKGDGNFRCKICPHLLINSENYGLSNKENLKRDYQHHLQHHISRWKCSLCSHTHFRKDTMEQHLRRLHPEEEGEPIELPRF
ncbi:Oidioi.mRNA.OKI2018_I69.chr2.g4980.t2.cds [Oikopleura dioica]|uniref:Oidioi.mRNA.OKI2018_I69.chr2.g4980.t2.cds n=1 Tax=Oikopleura dioica TaxID=34765 RepID=A0ABN7T5J9_OIKDI|nr:Oidioi.mRNA.OKI2018_I69.chr2.g4980.t2.cds [Oikopleura dioica]